MEQNEKRSPDFRGRIEVAGWKKKDKNGKTYFTIKISDVFNLFEVTEKPQDQDLKPDPLITKVRK